MTELYYHVTIDDHLSPDLGNGLGAGALSLSHWLHPLI